MPTAPEPAPDPLLTRAREYVNATGTADETNVGYSLAEARALVENWVGESAIPEAILDRAIIEVTADLFYRTMARNGVMDFGGQDITPFRIARDPMKAAYAILTQFIPAGIG